MSEGKTSITKITLQGFKSFNRRISIPFVNGFNIICGPNGVGKCVVGDTLVSLADGSLKRIKDMVEESLKSSGNTEKVVDGYISYENPLNFEILTLNPMTLKIEKKSVDAFIKRKSPKKLFKIKTRTGKEIITTGYHPFFVLENGILNVVNADNLSKGKRIATPRIIPVKTKESIYIFNKIFPEDNLYFPCEKDIKKIILDLKKDFGSYKRASEKLGIPYHVFKRLKSKNSIELAYLIKILLYKGINTESFIESISGKNFTENRIETNLSEDLARFIGYLISDGFSSKRFDQSKSIDLEILEDFSNLTEKLLGFSASRKEYKLKSTVLNAYYQDLREILKIPVKNKIFLNSREKRVPSQIFSAPKKIIASFLSALIDVDGRICVKISQDGKNEIYLEYATKSKGLAFDVASLFLRLGIVSFVEERRIARNNSIEIYYTVNIYGTENLVKLNNILKLRSEVKREKIKELKSQKLKTTENFDVIPNLGDFLKRLFEELNIEPDYLKKIYTKDQDYYEIPYELNRRELLELIRFVLSNFSLNRELLNILKSLYVLATSDIFWDEIIEIEILNSEEDWVYDLCINGYHNFIANNIIIHNSNVVDGICFVLGRTSAKSLRADRLHELIFHGSENKQSAQYASVTLHLDNSNRVFPFEETEITVTRKVNKNGVSVYKLNGRNTTREKILEVLSIARIYPDGHNIVLQGDITQIIEMSPTERREILDEISGIAEYNDKKAKAQKDLEAVDQKLKEAEIVITQRYDIYRKLEEERNAAIKYQNLTQQLNLLKASYANKKFKILQDQLDKIKEVLAQKEVLNEKITEEIKKVEEDLEKKETGIRDIANKLIELSKRFGIEKEISEIRSKLLIKKEKLETNLQELERLNSLIEKLEILESKKIELSGEIPRSVEAILSLKLRGVYGTVADSIEVPEKYRIAIEVAAGPHLYDIITEDEAIASYCIEYLKREKIGRATFLPLNKIKAVNFKDDDLLKREGVINLASRLIKFDPKILPAVEFVFGNTLVVKDLNAARNIGIGKVRMVTLDGDLIERSGAMVGGYYIKSHPKLLETKIKQDIAKYIELRKSLMQEIEILKREIEDLEKRLKEKAVEETTKEFIDLEKIRITSEKEIDELRERKKKLYQRKLNLEIEINQSKIEQAKLETELASAKIEKDKYNMTNLIDEKLNVLENSIQKVEKELMHLGPVNLRAIEEFEKFSSEFDEYKKRYEKILEEKRAVLNMIEEIESKRKEVFNKTLQEVNKNFNDIYTKLVGGIANISLENPDDIESGLLIQVNPKGKKLVNMDALSGGEKSLAALAFIFAIQKYKPAPFYILDEVDAALDKENSIRVAELIKNLSKDAQFLMITHNDQVIKYGDRIFGVTMEEGESKILGLEMPQIIG